jgi:CheY-like chemotaxis protein
MARRTTAGGSRHGRSTPAKRKTILRNPPRNAPSISELRKQLKLRDVELRAARETASANVLKAISRSAFDLGSVLNDIARVASDLCSADDVTILIREGDHLRIAAHFDLFRQQYRRDIRAGGGLEMLPKMRSQRPGVPVIMITAYGDTDTKRKAIEGGGWTSDQADRLRTFRPGDRRSSPTRLHELALDRHVSVITSIHLEKL